MDSEKGKFITVGNVTYWESTKEKRREERRLKNRPPLTSCKFVLLDMATGETTELPITERDTDER